MTCAENMGSSQSAANDVGATLEGRHFSECTSDWMGFIVDDVKISDLSIPGTHQSCAVLDILMSRCQTTSIKEQLEGGIRFLDIRVRPTADGLPVHHGILYQMIDLFDVLNECDRFLENHPTETILMSLKGNEDDPSINAISFSEAFAKEVDRVGMHLWGRFFAGNWIPTLKEARGKIIILKRAGATKVPTGGIDIEDFENGENSSQDGIK